MLEAIALRLEAIAVLLQPVTTLTNLTKSFLSRLRLNQASQRKLHNAAVLGRRVAGSLRLLHIATW